AEAPGEGPAGEGETAPPDAASSQVVTGVESVSIGDEEDAELFTEFLTETQDHLAAIEEKILALEESPEDVEAINAVFRPFHSMKGAAGFLGLEAINHFAHENETLLDQARKGAIRIDAAVVDTLLKSVDLTGQLVANLAAHVEAVARGEAPPEPAPVDVGPVLAEIRAHLSGGRPAAQAPAAEAAGGEAAGPPPEPPAAEPAAADPEAKAEARPEGKPQGPEAAARPPEASAPGARTSAARGAATGAKVESQYIKVEARKLDALMESIGELSIAHTLVAQDPALLDHERASSLIRNITELGKITKQVQDLVMAVRMVPLRATFQKMTRLVRDVARKTGKRIHLELVGEDTEIDKTLVEELADPLIHLLRNACDHGIGTPEERRAEGKPEVGRVTLAAYHAGGNVVIEIRDDGRGLDRERILEKAVAKGLVDPARDFSDAEVYGFIFLPGFSTVDRPTEISGRGVGMDVVKRQIEKLGGRVEIASVPGEGCTFTLKMPLTTAIVDGMIVRLGEERYIIPTLAIRESVRPKGDDIHVVQGKGEVIDVRDTLIPLIRLHERFGQRPRHEDPAEGLVVIVEHEGRARGLLVDDLLGQHQVVIKSLGPRLAEIDGLAGCAILGDGQVGLILDVGTIAGWA
ncbi:MAG: chemotaxis protein CheA, partial [Nitrospirae bacterium]